jgi:hypothetical protein
VLAVRIADHYRTHWMYGTNDHYLWQEVRCSGANKWQQVKIDLTNPDEWKRFQFDGNPTYSAEAPNFSEIMAVVIEFAKSDGEKHLRPAPGSGVVEIADFTIDDRPLDDPIEEPDA